MVANPCKYDNKLISTLKLDVHAVLTSGNLKPSTPISNITIKFFNESFKTLRKFRLKFSKKFVDDLIVSYYTKGNSYLIRNGDRAPRTKNL